MVGDYPLQIMCAMKGDTYYFNEVMGVYRVDNGSSWTGRQVWNKYSEHRVNIIRSQVNMFRGFAKDYPKWRKILHNKEVDQILRSIPGKKGRKSEDYKKYVDAFSMEISNLTFIERLEMRLRMTNSYYLKRLYYRTWGERFLRKTKTYK